MKHLIDFNTAFKSETIKCQVFNQGWRVFFFLNFNLDVEKTKLIQSYFIVVTSGGKAEKYS